MLKLLFSTFFLSIGLLSFADIDTKPILEKEEITTSAQNIKIPIQPQELSDRWELAFVDGTKDGSFVIEWVPKGEKIESWNELLQVQYIPIAAGAKGIINAEMFANHFLSALKNLSPSMSTSIIFKTQDSVLLEWRLPQKVGNEIPQHEIVRLISTKSGLYRIAYTKKVPQLSSDDKFKWKDSLTKARLD